MRRVAMQGLSLALMLAGCAGEKLALAPPAGTDFSGHWRLNVAESDDPQRLIQNQMGGPGSIGPGSDTPNRGGGGGGTPGGGRPGGRGPDGGGGGGGAPGPGGFGGELPAPMPAMGALSAGLRWPGRELDVKQVAGVVAFTSDGVNRIFQPTTSDAARHRKRSAGAGQPRDRDMHTFERGDGPPELSGWAGGTLVVRSPDMDEDHPPSEQRYSLSPDGQRLIEVVGFKGRSAGFSLSRVWDRVPPTETAVGGAGSPPIDIRSVPATVGHSAPQ